MMAIDSPNTRYFMPYAPFLAGRSAADFIVLHDNIEILDAADLIHRISNALASCLFRLGKILAAELIDKFHTLIGGVFRAEDGLAVKVLEDQRFDGGLVDPGGPQNQQHPVVVSETDGITIEVPNPNSIVILGPDKQKVGQFAAEVREKRPPEPYKGKGIKYAGEVIRRKEGKAGKGSKK